MPATKPYKPSFTEVHHDLLQQHRFSDEGPQPLLNRMLTRLSHVLAAGETFGPWVVEYQPPKLHIWTHDRARLLAAYSAKPTAVSAKRIAVTVGDGYCIWDGYSFGKKPHAYPVRPNETVEQLVKKYFIEDNAATFDRLVEWAVQLPRLGELQNADEAMGLLRRFAGQRVSPLEVLEVLTRHCTDDRAKEFLMELDAQGTLRLLQSGTKEKVRFPEHRRFTAIEFD